LSTIWSFCSAIDDKGPAATGLAGTTTERVQQALEKNLADDVFLAHSAKEAGASRGHLIKVVGEQWGATPMEIFWRHRTDAAARLLRETGLTIGEVAARTG